MTPLIYVDDRMTLFMMMINITIFIIKSKQCKKKQKDTNNIKHVMLLNMPESFIFICLKNCQMRKQELMYRKTSISPEPLGILNL